MMTATAVMTAQNVQLHYDFGHTIDGELSGRPNVTTTVEMFKPDALGSTFMFTDIDYYADGAAGAYWEIAREFNLTKNKQWAAHVEYNGGATTVEHTSIATRIQHALLAGVAWNWNSADFSKTFSLQAMFKQYFNDVIGILAEKIGWLPQFADDSFEDSPVTENIDGKFHLMFAGNIGTAQSVDTILKAAEIIEQYLNGELEIPEPKKPTGK